MIAQPLVADLRLDGNPGLRLDELKFAALTQGYRMSPRCGLRVGRESCLTALGIAPRFVVRVSKAPIKTAIKVDRAR